MPGTSKAKFSKSSLGKGLRVAMSYIANNSAAAVIGAIALGIIAIVTTMVEKVESTTMYTVGLFVVITIVVIALAIVCMQLWALRDWSRITSVIGLESFEEVNSASNFMPSKIIERESIKSLLVMANGCSKWTYMTAPGKAQEKFRQMREANREIRFLASCPIRLNATGDQRKIAKAKKNATSLLALKAFKDATQYSTGNFEIRTYKHLATLRLIIVDGSECVVGHYKEDGLGDSLETPLMVFNCDDSNEWGFGHAFCRLFESEWARAGEPTVDEWQAMRSLLSTGPAE